MGEMELSRTLPENLGWTISLVVEDLPEELHGHYSIITVAQEEFQEDEVWVKVEYPVVVVLGGTVEVFAVEEDLPGVPPEASQGFPVCEGFKYC
jgi:hypothetical protein